MTLWDLAILPALRDALVFLGSAAFGLSVAALLAARRVRGNRRKRRRWWP